MNYNRTYNKTFSSNSTDVDSHLPRSFQLILEVEQRAELKFEQILADIQTGKTTLEQVMRERGLLN